MTAKELRAKRKELADQMRSLTNKGALTAEDQTQFDNLYGESEKLKAQIERLDKLDAVDAELTEVRSIGVGREDRGVVTEVKPEQRQIEAWRSFIVNGPTEMPHDLVGELRALTLSGTSGYTAPALANSEYVEKLRDFSEIRQAPITVFNTASGADIPFPVLDDTANTASGPTAENTDVGNASDPSVAQIVLKSYMTTSGVLKVSRQFLRDSVIPAEQWLNSALVERIAVKQNALFTTGTGTSQQQGIVTGASLGKTLSTGHATSLGAGANDAAIAKDLISNLYDLIASVPKRYHVTGKTGFMFNQNTFIHLAKYVDGNGRPLLQSANVAGLAQGADATLLGYPVWINSDIADIGASAKSVLFGNFSYFYVRDVGAIAVDRLVERYAEYLVVGFNGYHASDSKVMNSSAIKYIQHSAT